MKILITGVGGFIGSRIAAKLIRLGHVVVGVDNFCSGRKLNVPNGVDLITHDLASPGVDRLFPEKVDAVMHLAGQSSGEISFDDPVDDLSKNTVSTLNLIRYALRAGNPKFLYASSMSTYGNVPDRPVSESRPGEPLSCYGVGKLASEKYLKVYSAELDSIAFRMFNVYGPGQNMQNLRQGMASIFIAQALKGPVIEVKGSLDRFRDFIFIDDVVDAWIAALGTNIRGSLALNLGTGTRTTVRDLLNTIQRHTGERVTRLSEDTPGDQIGIYADTTNLMEILDVQDFTTLDMGVKLFIEHLRNDGLNTEIHNS